MRDQDDVSQCRVRPGARAGQQAAVLRAGSPHQPVSPQYAFQEEQEKPLPVHSSQCCKCCPVPAAQQDPPTAPSPPAPHIGDAQEWGPCLPWGAGPQPKWGSTSPHTLSPSLFPSSLPCLPVFLCCLPAPQCGSPPVGLSRSGQGCGGHGNGGGKDCLPGSLGKGQQGWREACSVGAMAEVSGGSEVAAWFVPTRASVSPSVITPGPCTPWHCPKNSSVPLCPAPGPVPCAVQCHHA